MASWRRWTFGRWNWHRPLRSLVVIYLSVSLVACSFANKFIFHPPPPQYAADDDDLVLLDPGAAQVAAYYLPPAARDPVVLWEHGNAEDIGLLKPILIDLHNRGLGVLAYDYPGYGHSSGSPSETSCYRAAARAYKFLVEEERIAPSRIVLLGQSVGSGPACWLAEHEEVGGLILIAPFLSAFRTFTRIPLLPGDKFPNLSRIGDIDAPLLVIHGSRDGAIPLAHGQRLFLEHPGPKLFREIPDSGHNDLWYRAGGELMDDIAAFARSPSQAAHHP